MRQMMNNQLKLNDESSGGLGRPAPLFARPEE